MIDILNEGGRAEGIGLVEDLISDAAALGQAALGELHAHPGQAVARHHHDRAVVLELVRDGLALEILHDRGGILRCQVGEHRRHLRRRDAENDEGEDPDQGSGDRAHGGKARSTQRSDKFDEPLHGLCPSRSPGRTRRPTRTPKAPDPASFAGIMVSIWLTAVRSRIAACHKSSDAGPGAGVSIRLISAKPY
jgi:hypothetical protein